MHAFEKIRIHCCCLDTLINTLNNINALITIKMKHIKGIFGHSLHVVYVLMRFNELPVLYSPTHDFQSVTAN